MKKKYYQLIIASFILCYGCAESIISINPSKVSLKEIPSQYSVYGYYSLPKTVLKLRIPVCKKKFTPGLIKHKDESNECLAKYVLDNFGWKPIEKPKEIVGIDNGTIVETISEPDPKKNYAIIYKNSKAISQTIKITLNKDGIIQSGEFAQESKVYDITKKSIELVGAGMSSFGFLGKETEDDSKKENCIESESIETEEGRKLVKRVKELLQKKYEYVTEYPQYVENTEVLKFPLSQIDKEIKQLKGKLIGSVSKKVYYVTLFIDPKKDFESIKLFDINTRKGIFAKEGSLLANLSETIKTSESSNLKSFELVVLKKRVPITENTLTSNVSKVKTDDGTYLKGDSFLHYNIPAKYYLSLKYGNKGLNTHSSSEDKKGSGDIEVYFPQLGQVAYLNKDFKGAEVVYYEDTGGIKSYKLTREAELTADRIEGIYSAIDSVNTTIKALKEEKKKESSTEEEKEDEVEEQVIRLIIDQGSALKTDKS